ncbi:MAG TPA: hypothetical protein VNV42_02515 [Solirubrobacteraceae bacterium]|nr:hypothetical protein [Solirubrobacteraceae bacterium]
MAEHAVIEEPAAAEPAQQRLPAAVPPSPLEALGALRAAGNSAIAGLLQGGLRAQLTRQVEGNPGAPSGTANADPSVADAANHQAPAAPGGQSANMAVKVKATPEAPLEGESVSEEDLFEKQAAPTQESGSSSPSSSSGSPAPESSSSGSAAPGSSSAPAQQSEQQSSPSSSSAPDGFTTVKEISGTAAAPIVEESADNSLFIDPGPKADDVQQGQIGDCWDLATFIAIVSSDPGKIQSMMSPDGSGGASVTFYRRQAVAATPGTGAGAGAPPAAPTYDYIPTVVAVNKELPMDLAQPDVTPSVALAIRTLIGDQPYGHSVHGAQLRAADTPKVSKWWCIVNGETLEVHRLEVFQMARWSPLLEKAGARFSEEYGQYGHGEKTEQANNPEGEQQDPSQGYGNLEGGWPRYTTTLFYGKEGEQVAGGQSDTSETAALPPNATSEAVLNANQASFERLLTLSGQGEANEQGAVPDEGKVGVVTADTASDVYYTRLQEALVAAEGDPDWANLKPPTTASLAKVASALKALEKAEPDPEPLPKPPPPNCKTALQEAAAVAATTAAEPATNPTLIDEKRSKAIKDMLDQLLIVENEGKDHGAATQSVYPEHAYAVLGVEILDTSGKPSTIRDEPPAKRQAMFGTIDVEKSMVKMMNPHHANVPDPTGTVHDKTGVFPLTLDRFFRLFANVTSSQVTPTNPQSIPESGG